jgi:predicted RNase H-like HicB family nuclease
VAEVNHYRAVVTRESGKWQADVPDVPGAHTWAPSLAGLDHNAREAIALVLDLPPKAEKDLDLELEFHVGGADFDAAVAELRHERSSHVVDHGKVPH